MPVTANLDMVPGPLDRPEPVARAIRWWVSSLTGSGPAGSGGATKRRRTTAHALERAAKSSSSRQVVTLNHRDCFIAHLSLPPGAPEAHKRAIALRLDELAPIAPGKLSVAAIAVRRSETDVTYAIAMARKDRLKSLTDQARRQGARILHFTPQSADHIPLRTDEQVRSRRISQIIDGLLASGLVLAIAIAAHVQTDRYRQETEQLLDLERAARAQVIALENDRRNAALANDLTTAGVLARRPGAALDALANVNAATPDTAWWTSIRWSPDEILLAAKSRDAVGALQLLSQDALRWSVEPIGTVTTDPSDGSQSFEARLTLRPPDPS